MESSESSEDAMGDAGAGERSYSEETSSEYSESPKSSEGGLGGGGGRLRFLSARWRPLLPFLLPAMVHAEGGEVKKKEKTSDQERVKKAAEAGGLFKEAGGRPSTSCHAHRTVIRNQ
jgi:hypothetical protein